MLTSSCKCLYKKSILLMFSLAKCQCWVIANASTNLTITNSAIRKNVLLKSTLSCCVVLCNETSFVMLYRAIRFVLDLVHPSASNGMLSKRQLNNKLSIILSYSLQFSYHSFSPMLMLESFIIKNGFIGEERAITNVSQDGGSFLSNRDLAHGCATIEDEVICKGLLQ